MKQDASTCQLVNVRRETLGMAIETSDPVVQVINCKEQHVWLGLVGEGNRCRQSLWQNNDAK